MVMGVEGREVDRVLHGRGRMWVEHVEGGEDETSILALHFLSNSQIQLSDWLHDHLLHSSHHPSAGRMVMLIGRFSGIPETTGTTVVDKICTTGIERRCGCGQT